MNRSGAWPTPTQMVAERTGRRSSRTRVSRDQALTHSAVWACLNLRADLVSTMPVDVFRRVQGVQVEVTKPPVFVTPGLQHGGSKPQRWMSWMYATQFDLDSYGNTFGIIRSRDGANLPAVIELVSATSVTMRCKDGVITYQIGGKSYPERDIWHEKQYEVAGLPMGLSPIAHAALSISGYLSAQQFAADWFANQAIPGGHLKNTAKTLNRKESLKAKASFKAAVSSGDVWVSGNDWDYNVLGAKASEVAFLDTMGASETEVCRFLGVPGDMIDVATKSGSITYANVTQRNLQFLITKLGPAVLRREDAFSADLLPQPRYAKLNANALLRMDLKGRLDAYKVAIDTRIMTPTEARELEERAPLTPEQEAEFARLFPAKAAPTVQQGVPS